MGEKAADFRIQTSLTIGSGSGQDIRIYETERQKELDFLEKGT